jgi:hypothetical protein
MKGIQEIYSEAVHVNFPRYFANFPPNIPIRLGDYGDLRRDCFDRRGNVTDRFGVGTRSRIKRSAPSTFEFRSGRSVSVTLRAKGDVLPSGIPAVKAGMGVNFSRGRSVLFNAAGCTVESIEDIDGFGKRLLDLFQEKRWEADRVVVTSFIAATTLTLVISAEANASIDLEADGDLSSIDLSQARIKLHMTGERGLAAKYITEGNTFPLVGLSRVQKRIFGPRFQTRYATYTPQTSVDMEAEAERIRAVGGSIKEVFALVPIDDTQPLQPL